MSENGSEEEEVNVLMEGVESGSSDEENDEVQQSQEAEDQDNQVQEVRESEGDRSEETDSSDEEAEQFDISLAASHSYMGLGLQPVPGRSVLEAGWEGSVPVVAHHGAVFPGETVPMLLSHSHDAALLTRAIATDNKLFGLLCPDESGELVSGYGVVCEVFEASSVGDTPPPAPAGFPPAQLSFKARATHRFRFLQMPKQPLSLHFYDRMKYEKVRILPEIEPCDPLRRSRLCSLDPHRRHRTPMDRRLRSLDAAATSWPLFVYDMFDYPRMRQAIRDYFHTIMLGDKLPSEPVSLSFWVARNLALSPRDRLALFVVDSALLRLHMAVKDISRKSVLCCASCANEIARRDHIFPMSSEGVHSNYTNLGGYMHDVITVSRAGNTVLSGPPSAEYSWFPGYTWTIAHCGACMAHVGWRFDAQKRTLRPQQFYGLCRNHVTPRAADQAPLPPVSPAAPHPANNQL